MYTLTAATAVAPQASLLKNVLVRFTATTGSAGAAAVLLLTAEEVVVEELERRVFCVISMSFARMAAAESSGMVSGATVEAEKVAWFEGRRARKWLTGCVDIVVGDWVVIFRGVWR